ncbi:hypothetical protein MKW98_003560 [Papaver atlanticum]|uniref:Uncharacterized protein n=1 Tax=Papaver atlanticum TaxID=357466 RepID=A0AAD4TBB8_9MAGN|nr:hypothetical protein MKW98_003560 [Papaver atlanticum]
MMARPTKRMPGLDGSKSQNVQYLTKTALPKELHNRLGPWIFPGSRNNRNPRICTIEVDEISVDEPVELDVMR